eukprot:11208846-Lingulodinium_polyedra.AAC.1
MLPLDDPLLRAAILRVVLLVALLPFLGPAGLGHQRARRQGVTICSGAQHVREQRGADASQMHAVA